MAICWERAVLLDFHLRCFILDVCFFVPSLPRLVFWAGCWNSIVSAPYRCLFSCTCTFRVYEVAWSTELGVDIIDFWHFSPDCLSASTPAVFLFAFSSIEKNGFQNFIMISDNFEEHAEGSRFSYEKDKVHIVRRSWITVHIHVQALKVPYKFSWSLRHIKSRTGRLSRFDCRSFSVSELSRSVSGITFKKIS